MNGCSSIIFVPGPTTDRKGPERTGKDRKGPRRRFSGGGPLGPPGADGRLRRKFPGFRGIPPVRFQDFPASPVPGGRLRVPGTSRLLDPGWPSPGAPGGRLQVPRVAVSRCPGCPVSRILGDPSPLPQDVVSRIPEVQSPGTGASNLSGPPGSFLPDPGELVRPIPGGFGGTPSGKIIDPGAFGLPAWPVMGAAGCFSSRARRRIFRRSRGPAAGRARKGP